MIRHHTNRGVVPLKKEDKMGCKDESQNMQCCKDESHNRHICYLKAQGLEFDDCLRSVADKPTVECRHCGARANSMEYVCAATLGEDAPNVEGGHGMVDVDEVGMPHEGGTANQP
jgi:hypothetical protein